MAELLPPELPLTTTLTENPSHLTTKRQRRPSVRLGEIGDQPATLSYEAYRPTKLWNDTRYRFYPHKDTGKSLSRTRPLTNLTNGHETLETVENVETLDGEGNLGNLSRGRDSKGKRGGVKRVRSNWVSAAKEVEEEGYDKFSGDEWYRDFDADDDRDRDRSGSSLKEHSPIPVQLHSLENTNVVVDMIGNEKDGVFLGQRRMVKTRGSESHGAVELDVRSDNDGTEWKCTTASVERNGGSERGRCRSLEDGVRMWLNGLGLGRYEAVFEIHEVDEEVLPLLTLEDLKDMGINAVGSRRKLYSAIQKLGRGFS